MIAKLMEIVFLPSYNSETTRNQSQLAVCSFVLGRSVLFKTRPRFKV